MLQNIKFKSIDKIKLQNYKTDCHSCMRKDDEDKLTLVIWPEMKVKKKKNIYILLLRYVMFKTKFLLKCLFIRYVFFFFF